MKIFIIKVLIALSFLIAIVILLPVEKCDDYSRNTPDWLHMEYETAVRYLPGFGWFIKDGFTEISNTETCKESNNKQNILLDN